MLHKFGYNQHFEDRFHQLNDSNLIPARILKRDKNLYKLGTADGVIRGELSGRYHYQAKLSADYPAVGDWVAVKKTAHEDKAIIHHLLERMSKISRKTAGNTTDEQIIACNINTIFIVSGLDRDFNIKRLERYITLAWNSGCIPVVILNKADICDDIEEKKAEIEAITFGMPVLTVSALQNAGLEALNDYLQPASTIAFIGSSGVGKSTIINSLLHYERQKVNTLSDDEKGRHTTTSSELIILENGALLIDTPGLKELQLWDDTESLSASFSDVEHLISHCKFRNCTHQTEPGCAIIEALENRELDEVRWKNYVKLQKEMTYLAGKKDDKYKRIENEKWKKIAKLRKKMYNKYNY